MNEKRHRTPARWRSVLMAAAAVTVIAGMLAVYEISGRTGNADGEGCIAAAPRAQAIAPLAVGEVAAVMVPDRPSAVPDLAFVDDEGNERRLSDWRGRVTLVNLWATWCPPCLYEMPALDNLQAELGSDDFEVVAINIDMSEADKPKEFLREIEATRLAFYADPSTGVFRELKAAGRAFGMPTTLIIDRDGCELGHLAGPAEWDSQEAMDMIRAAVAAR